MGLIQKLSICQEFRKSYQLFQVLSGNKFVDSQFYPLPLPYAWIFGFPWHPHCDYSLEVGVPSLWLKSGRTRSSVLWKGDCSPFYSIFYLCDLLSRPEDFDTTVSHHPPPHALLQSLRRYNFPFPSTSFHSGSRSSPGRNKLSPSPLFRSEGYVYDLPPDHTSHYSLPQVPDNGGLYRGIIRLIELNFRELPVYNLVPKKRIDIFLTWAISFVFTEGRWGTLE